MNMFVRSCNKVSRLVTLGRLATPHPLRTPTPTMTRAYVSQVPSVGTLTALGKVNCACGGHPWPQETEEVTIKVTKDCEFDFRKNEVNPYDIPCDCKDPPPAAGCGDVGKPKMVCCRSTRQYGCHCEDEAEESCEEEEDEVIEGIVTCDLDFRKLEVNPYDDPCECIDPPPPASCEDLLTPRDICCRAPKAFGCACEAYDDPGLTCIQPKKTTKTKKVKKECVTKKFDVKCA